MSRRAVLTPDNVRVIRETAALPRGKRPKSLRLIADLLGVSYSAVVRCGRREQRCYTESYP